jgi:polyisoprenoid-binding protein YceI
MRSLFAALAVTFLATTIFAEEKKVNLTGDNTKVTWVGTKPGGKHEGGFKTLTGTATVDGDKLKSIEVTIETESLYADDAKLTAHLKSPDFFGVKNNPKATFKTTKVDTTDGVKLTGDLTINGKTKSITFPVNATVSGGTVKITGETSIDKRDYGMTYGGGKIDDQVAIKVAVEAK